MRMAAIVFWLLSLGCLAFSMYFNVGSITISTTDVSTGVTTSDTSIHGFFDGITALGAMVYGAIFTFFLAGCVFWTGHELRRARA